MARTINLDTTLGALPSALEGGVFDFAIFPARLAGGYTAVCPNNNCSGLQLIHGPGGTSIFQQWVPWYVVGFHVIGGNAGATVYWHWVTVGTASDNGTSSFWAFAAPWYFQPRGPGHGGPYRPNVGPQEPENPIWPKQLPPKIITDDPENYVPPTPTLWDKTKVIILKVFQAFGSDGSTEVAPFIFISPCESGAMPQLGPGGMSCPKMY